MDLDDLRLSDLCNPLVILSSGLQCTKYYKVVGDFFKKLVCRSNLFLFDGFKGFEAV